MYRRILVGIDGSHGARVALRRAIQLTGEHDAMLHAVVVEEGAPPDAGTIDENEDAWEDTRIHSAQVIDQARKVAASAGVRITCEVRQGNAARILIERGRQLDCELIILGHTRRDWGSLLGSTANRVVDHARCDVLIVRTLEPHTRAG